MIAQLMDTRDTIHTNEERWQAVIERDKRFDGEFVFAVRSTGIFCRPTCPARRPRRENVLFYSAPGEAEGAGFRPCLRCRPTGKIRNEQHEALAQQVCRAIEANLEREEVITLEELGAELSVSPHHLQRVFKKMTGITPHKYAAMKRVEKLKAGLKSEDNVTQAMYGAGYGSSSRLYESAPRSLGMTPSAYKHGGRGMDINYAIIKSPLGYLLVGATDKGVCAVRLGDSEKALEEGLFGEFHAANLRRDDKGLGRWVEPILAHLKGNRPHLDLPIDVQATSFQRRVWEELQSIPYGSTRSYSQIARSIGQPSATRAVARACATNSVALIVPCHRVVRENGDLGGYRWGVERKERLLAQERQSSANSKEDIGNRDY